MYARPANSKPATAIKLTFRMPTLPKLTFRMPTQTLARTGDPAAPKSLLGCQMSNQCPAGHPALLRSNTRRSRARERGGRAMPRGELRAATVPKPGSCCARLFLAAVSLVQLTLVAALLGLPSVSPGAADLLRLARLDRCAGASNVTYGHRTLLLPSKGAASSPHAGSATSASGGSAGAIASSSGLGLLTTGAQPLSALQLEGQLDMGDLVLGVVIACCVLGVDAFLGLVIAATRRGSMLRATASALYFSISLPVAVALGFAVAYCFAFRTEAESLVQRYWLCLLLTEPGTHAGA